MLGGMPASESPLYEVRCPSCRTSFPPETKRCIHCGGPLGKRLLAFEGASSAGVTSRAGTASNAPQPPRADAPPNIGRYLRFALIALGVAAALARRFLENP